MGAHTGLHYGGVDEELLLRNEYLATENRILKAQIKRRLLLSDAEKKALAEIAHRLGRKALEDVVNAAKPDTILCWHRKLIARKVDGSKVRRYPGRPRVDSAVEALVVRMVKENLTWGYDRIVGALANRGYLYRMKRSAIYYVAMVSHPTRSESTPWLGKSSFVPTWRYWRQPTFSL